MERGERNTTWNTSKHVKCSNWNGKERINAQKSKSNHPLQVFTYTWSDMCKFIAWDMNSIDQTEKIGLSKKFQI